MSPRIDHRPPVIAFLVLVVLAIAIIGTNARALDRVVVAGEPLEVHVRVQGTAPMQNRAERVRPASRATPRTSVAAAPAAEPATKQAAEATRQVRAVARQSRVNDHRSTRALLVHRAQLKGFHGRALGVLAHVTLPVGRTFGQH